MKLTLISKKQETPNVFTFIFKPETPLAWTAGQFLNYKLEDPQPDERSTRRFFSIASAPFEENIQITTKFVPGDGSTFKRDLQKLEVGDSIEANGPSGEFIIDDPQKEYIFIAGGIGVTPFRAILKDLEHNNLHPKITLLYANRDNNFVFKDEFTELLEKDTNLSIHYFVDPQRIDETAIKQYVPNLLTSVFYVSGPEPMVEAFEKMLAQMGVLDENIKRDYFPGYSEI